MAQKLNIFSGRQFLDSSGDPYVGAQLFSYVAGSSTKVTLTKDSAGASNHANPIILNARGEPGDGAGASQAMWQAEGVTVKLVLAPAGDTDPPVAAISTWDNLSGINDSAASSAQDEWVSGNTPTYVSTTSFTLVGDQTSDFHVGRRLKTTNSGGTLYSTITAVSFTSLTTVTVANDSTALDSGLSAVSYAVISAVDSSSPGVLNHTISFSKGADIASATALITGNDGNSFDVTGTTAITSINAVGIGANITLQFDGILTLTHNVTDLILPTAGDITTAAGDIAVFNEYAAGDWRCVSYTRADGTALAVNAPIPDSFLYLGSGSDGSKTVSTNETWENGEYHYTDLTINVSQTVTSTETDNAFIIVRCTGTVLINGDIDLDGVGATGAIAISSTAGTTGTASILGGSGGGGARSNADGGDGGPAASEYGSFAGGVGRTGSNGVGGAASATPTRITNSLPSFPNTKLYGAGGGSGGNSAATGGDGGNGGGGLIIIADTITFNAGAIITADGGAGVTGVGASGGGGGGGVILLYAATITNDGAITVTAGAGGTGTTYDGGAGAAGYSAVTTT